MIKRAFLIPLFLALTSPFAIPLAYAEETYVDGGQPYKGVASVVEEPYVGIATVTEPGITVVYYIDDIVAGTDHIYEVPDSNFENAIVKYENSDAFVGYCNKFSFVNKRYTSDTASYYFASKCEAMLLSKEDETQDIAVYFTIYDTDGYELYSNYYNDNEQIGIEAMAQQFEAGEIGNDQLGYYSANYKLVGKEIVGNKVVYYMTPYYNEDVHIKNLVDGENVFDFYTTSTALVKELNREKYTSLDEMLSDYEAVLPVYSYYCRTYDFIERTANGTTVTYSFASRNEDTKQLENPKTYIIHYYVNGKRLEYYDSVSLTTIDTASLVSALMQIHPWFYNFAYESDMRQVYGRYRQFVAGFEVSLDGTKKPINADALSDALESHLIGATLKEGDLSEYEKAYKYGYGTNYTKVKDAKGYVSVKSFITMLPIEMPQGVSNAVNVYLETSTGIHKLRLALKTYEDNLSTTSHIYVISDSAFWTDGEVEKQLEELRSQGWDFDVESFEYDGRFEGTSCTVYCSRLGVSRNSYEDGTRPATVKTSYYVDDVLISTDNVNVPIPIDAALTDEEALDIARASFSYDYYSKRYSTVSEENVGTAKDGSSLVDIRFKSRRPHMLTYNIVVDGEVVESRDEYFFNDDFEYTENEVSALTDSVIASGWIDEYKESYDYKGVEHMSSKGQNQKDENYVYYDFVCFEFETIPEPEPEITVPDPEPEPEITVPDPEPTPIPEPENPIIEDEDPEVTVVVPDSEPVVPKSRNPESPKVVYLPQTGHSPVMPGGIAFIAIGSIGVLFMSARRRER